MLNRLLLVLAIATSAIGQPVAIRNVRLFAGTRVVPSATVLIDGGRIVSINAAVPAAPRVIDGENKTLLPGLIDSHTTSSAPRSSARCGSASPRSGTCSPPSPRSDFGIDGKDLIGILIGGAQKSGKAELSIDDVKLK